MNIFIALVVALIFGLGGYYFYTAQEKTPGTDGPPSNTSMQSSTLTSVDRSNRGLTTMPADILAMTQVQQLDLSNNKLTGALPAEIRHLSQLQILNISNNSMTGLPAELGQLSKLRILNASNNQLTGVPHELGNLQNLEILDLSGNNISREDLEVIRGRLPSSTQIVL